MFREHDGTILPLAYLSELMFPHNFMLIHSLYVYNYAVRGISVIILLSTWRDINLRWVDVGCKGGLV